MDGRFEVLKTDVRSPWAGMPDYWYKPIFDAPNSCG
jgi:hypothetical protein